MLNRLAVFTAFYAVFLNAAYARSGSVIASSVNPSSPASVSSCAQPGSELHDGGLGAVHSGLSAVDHWDPPIAPCPASLQSLKSDYLPAELPSLCATYDRYQAALQNLRAANIATPNRIANVIAPRFIDLPDWQKALYWGTTNPAKVYDPAPQTWRSWDEARRLNDQIALENFQNGRVTPLNLPTLLAIHTAGMDGLKHAGDLRTDGMEIGLSLTRTQTLPYSQIQALQHIEYTSTTDPTKPILSWVATPCWNEIPEKIQKQISNSQGFNVGFMPKLADPSQTFTDSQGVQRQCGYIAYSPTSEVPEQLDHWIDTLNATTSTWGTAHPEGDPLLIAARAQRWFISIHPFAKGNGRTSRLIMDQILESEGLPTPIFTEMNDDVGTPEKQWARNIGQGMLRTIEALEACEKTPSARGCNVVPEQ